MTEEKSRVILASGSPRRAEILAAHGVRPVIMPMDVDETLPETEGPDPFRNNPSLVVETLARRKAQAAYDRIMADPVLASAYQGHLIIGSDTIVWYHEILGKPVDEKDAFRMLSSIRGTSHQVVTGVCLIDVDTGTPAVMSDTTTVWCKEYTDEDIYTYITEEPPYDKAGSYAIQSSFGKYIDHIEGDYENVVGFPYHLVSDIIANYI